MSPTSKRAKRREGVREESDDRLHSPKSEGDGGGVEGGVGEVLESWYVPHSLFVGSAAPAHIANLPWRPSIFSPATPRLPPPILPLPQSTLYCLRCAPIPSVPPLGPDSWGRCGQVPTADIPNTGIGHNSFKCGQVSCTSSTGGGGWWCVGMGGGSGWLAV